MSVDLLLGESGMREVTSIVRERQLRIYGHATRDPEECSGQIMFIEIRGADPCKGASTDFMVASGGVPSEGYDYGEPCDFLSDGQRKAEQVPSQGGRGDALFRPIYSYLT